MSGPATEVALVRAAVRRCVADLPRGSHLLVACSGGADSLALAAAASFLAPREGLPAGGVVVDHGLQPGSAEVAASVRTQLLALGLTPVRIVRVEVGRGGGPEAAARDARYAALRFVADDVGAAAVLLGHTLDDQAETVLLGLGRGSGARSLAGMAPVSGLWRRPLLGIPRETTRAACAAEGLPAWEDPHNADDSFARVRVRRDALPALERAVGPGVAAALARSARLLRADADALDGWAESAWRGLGAGAVLDAGELAGLPRAVRSRVLRLAATDAGVPPLALEHVEELDRLVTEWHGQGPVSLPAGASGRRAGGALLLTPGAVAGAAAVQDEPRGR